MLIHDKVCSFRVSPGLGTKIENRIKEMEMTPSEYYRYLIRRDLGEI